MTSPSFTAAWNQKFADLPLFPGRSILAPMDGDIAHLHHLQDTIFDTKPARLQSIPPDFIWQWTIQATGEDPDIISILLDAGLRRLARVIPS